MGTNRTNRSCIDRVAAFIDYAIHNLQKMSNIDPPVEEVQFHLFKNGIDLSYTKWSKHEENDEPSISAPKPVNATTEFVDDTNFASDIPIDGPTTVEMVNATKDNFDEDYLVKFQELLLDVEKPLYKGCPDFTKLSAIVQLLNLKGKYGCFDKFFTELLGLLKKMLPAGTEMMEKTYQAKKNMKWMGSGYKKIHVCINNGLLYWKDDKDLTVCRTCRISRWKVGNKTHKVYENIPAKRTIDEKFPEIAEDPRNLRLGISAEGFDVSKGNRHHRYPGNDIDVFLEPLVDDLHTLFETGVDTYDASTKDNFNLRDVVLWTINDYPVLGTLCGCPYSGFKGCVQKKAFNEQQEFLLAPNLITGEQIYNEVQHIENKWGKGKRTNNKASENQEDTRGRGGKIQKQKRNTTEEESSSSQVNEQNGAYWKKFNIRYRKLRCWRHNFVPHCIDFMHVEKNVAESLVGTLLNVLGKTKDGVNARLDLAELGVKPELFAMQEEDKTTLPPVGYTLTNAEKDIFYETLYNIRVPQGYCSNFSSLVSLKDRKLIGLKSQDYHMLMQDKEIRLQELDKMQAELVVTLCLLEKFFPPSFFDIMVIKGHVRNRNRPEGCIAEETIEEETIEFFSEYHKSMKTIGIPPDKHETDENEEGKQLSDGKSSEVSAELFPKAHLYVERELAISKESVSETVRWISYGPCAIVVKYDAYNINGQISLFKCDWVNHRAGEVKRDTTLGYTLVDLNNLGHKVDPFILASQARQVFYVKDQIDK
ncbi:putative transposon, En/Spm-like protein [Tanacetum coccineum]|uniref:Transposon, En/Spm-like protein n=1 Tax=Tanacetum coccineum TaxID=301880 RepID=A0ABQ5G944_9ASTR